MNAPLPELLDAKAIQAELGVKEATANRIVSACPRVKIGRRAFVKRADVRAYIDECTIAVPRPARRTR